MIKANISIEVLSDFIEKAKKNLQDALTRAKDKCKKIEEEEFGEVNPNSLKSIELCKDIREWGQKVERTMAASAYVRDLELLLIELTKIERFLTLSLASGSSVVTVDFNEFKKFEKWAPLTTSFQ